MADIWSEIEPIIRRFSIVGIINAIALIIVGLNLFGFQVLAPSEDLLWFLDWTQRILSTQFTNQAIGSVVASIIAYVLGNYLSPMLKPSRELWFAGYLLKIVIIIAIIGASLTTAWFGFVLFFMYGFPLFIVYLLCLLIYPIFTYSALPLADKFKDLSAHLIEKTDRPG